MESDQQSPDQNTAEPADAKSILAEAIELHQNGELTKAEKAYERLLELDPENTDAHHLMGVIAGQLGNTPVAIQRVKRSLELDPKQPFALNNLGNLLYDADRLDEAIESYQQALEITPGNAGAHHNLGNVLAECNRLGEALQSYQRATEIDADYIESWLALGLTHERLGNFESAESCYRRSGEIDPQCVAVHSRLGSVLRKTGRLEEARVVYGEWLRLDPENPIPQHLQVACGEGDEIPERASNEYVKKTFDAFAADFESCLSDLEYHVPEQLATLLRDRWAADDTEEKLSSVVDLGCGTGLCAKHLREFSDYLIGVDLSPRMLEKAEELCLYDKTAEAELTAYLQNCEYDEHDAILSADTLIYLGDLQPVFAAAMEATKPGGSLVFSIEKLDDDGQQPYQLGPSGRYAHRESGVRAWLAEVGFSVETFEEVQLRQEGKDAVLGFLVVAVKP